LKKIISVVGARPNFMKAAPIHESFQKYKNEIVHFICHTGQHYSEKMSKIFFEDLRLPTPQYYLGIGSASHAEQTAKIMIEFEKVIIKEKPDVIVVYGDVNSTIACSLVASKLHIPIAHVEAGLRSFDREMPEEINRILTDVISDFLFVSEKSGMINLKNEGISDDNVFFTGNVMIDSLSRFLKSSDSSKILEEYNLIENNFVLVTLHRPSNVDDPVNLTSIVKLLNKISESRKIIFPIHPRTKYYLEKYNLFGRLIPDIILTEPLGYIDFIKLIKETELVLTDSGGIQEETTFLGVQCITIRNSTERPITVEVGTNQIVGVDYSNVEQVTMNVLSGKIKEGTIPEKWDGQASERIVEILASKLL